MLGWPAIGVFALAATSCDLITGDDFDEHVTGQFEGQFVETRVITMVGPTGVTTATTCTYTLALRGSVVIDFARDSDGSVDGRARVNDVGRTETAVSGPASCGHAPPVPANNWQAAVTGSTTDFRFRGEQITNVSVGSVTEAVEFVGVANVAVISGTLTFSINGQGASGGGAMTVSGSATLPITLQ